MLAITESVMIDIEQVRARLDVSDSTVRRLVREGKLKAYRLGRRLKFRPEDVDRYVETTVVRPNEEVGESEAQP
jgi:excisionase family DNA binding protein